VPLHHGTRNCPQNVPAHESLPDFTFYRLEQRLHPTRNVNKTNDRTVSPLWSLELPIRNEPMKQERHISSLVDCIMLRERSICWENKIGKIVLFFIENLMNAL
jgi:hypothetical protein